MLSLMIYLIHNELAFLYESQLKTIRSHQLITL
jgi:hypothetical protein